MMDLRSRNCLETCVSLAHCLQHTMGRQNGWNVGQGPAEILLMNVPHLEEVPRQTIIAMLASAIGTNLLHMRYCFKQWEP